MQKKDTFTKLDILGLPLYQERGGLKNKDWVFCPKPKPEARLKLFCFPFAGGGCSVFNGWVELFPPEIEICMIQLPGRENLFNKTPFTRIFPLIWELTYCLSSYLDRPFAFFGHSMGALISFELVRHLRRKSLPLPSRLLVSSEKAPHIPKRDAPIHHLSDAEFVQKIRDYNGISKEVLNDFGIMQLLLPLLRADIEMCEKYFYKKERLIDCPISAFYGLADTTVSNDDVEAWQEQTDNIFTLDIIQGDHFFLKDNHVQLLKLIIQYLKHDIEAIKIINFSH